MGDSVQRKVNLHLVIPDGAFLVWALKVNRDVRATTFSVVNFDDPLRPMFPHVSLVMGELADGAALDEVIRTASVIARGATALQLVARAPYLENVRGRYVFADLEAPAGFYDLKAALHRAIVPHLMTTQVDYTTVPHVTLGHVDRDEQEVRALLAGESAGLTVTCESIALADAGPKGTCINLLWSGNLGQ